MATIKTLPAVSTAASHDSQVVRAYCRRSDNACRPPQRALTEQKAFQYRRVKNDLRDAVDLADLLRMGRLPEAWIAPPATRELRELVRHRAKLVSMCSRCKAQVHAVLAKCGVRKALAQRNITRSLGIRLPGAQADRTSREH
jgi:transposase